MGRFSVETSLCNPASNTTQPGTNQMVDWPTTFPKECIGIDRNGIILNDKPILSVDDMEILPGALEGIKLLRLKGYKVFLFFNEPLISQGVLTQQAVEEHNNHLMNIFGQAGILSIEGVLFSTTTHKQDIYAFPNTGMLKRAENEFKQKYKGGYFVGNNIKSLKAGNSAGARPVLIRSGNYTETEPKLNTFANKELKKRTLTFNSLFEFANYMK